MIHLNLMSHPVMQRPMCSPMTDLPQTDRTDRKRTMFHRNGNTHTKPRHRLAGPTWGKVVSREHEADRLARIAEPGDETEEDFQ